MDGLFLKTIVFCCLKIEKSSFPSSTSKVKAKKCIPKGRKTWQKSTNFLKNIRNFFTLKNTFFFSSSLIKVEIKKLVKRRKWVLIFHLVTFLILRLSVFFFLCKITHGTCSFLMQQGADSHYLLQQCSHFLTVLKT